MPMEYNTLFSGTSHDIFRKEVVTRSIRVLRESGRSDEEIKKELLRDFSVKEELLDEMLKA